MIHQFKNVLVLSPHTDDGELGCGGTIAKFVEAGAVIHYVAFSTAEKSVPAGYPKNALETEVREATRRLKISPDNLTLYPYEVRKLHEHRQEVLEHLVELSRTVKFDLVLQPSMYDIHQDHTTVAQESLRAFKRISILGYELIWNNLTFDTTAFVSLEKRHVDAKCAALSAYASQSGKPYMREEFISSLARARGVQIGAEYAETFEVIRWVM